jgi:F-type H+-transporting ATPase subunit a
MACVAPSPKRLLLLRGALAALLALGLAASAALQTAPEGEQPGEPHKTAEGKPTAAAGKADLPAMQHVRDSYELHFFDTIPPKHIPLPTLFGLQLTKFMVLELIAAGLILVIYVPLARRLARGDPPSGAWDNAFESLLTFVRDQIARPSLGEDIADRYVPFLWTLFLFILFNNIMGMVPFMGSPTASIYVTAALAVIVFFAIHGSAIIEMGRNGHGGHNGHEDHDHDHAGESSRPALFMRGLINYAKAQWPQIDLPGPMGWVIKPLVFVLELQGVLIRNAVLAVRLFANMFAGHMVLATILFFIQMAANVGFVLWGVITASSVLGILGLSLLELFVAFLQAYIFTFLAALFMGMAIHPSH